jgi:hypothetical protein
MLGDHQRDPRVLAVFEGFIVGLNCDYILCISYSCDSVVSLDISVYSCLLVDSAFPLCN